MWENTDQKKLRIWTPLTQWVSLIWYLKILHWKISAKSHTLEIWSRTKQNFLRKFGKLEMHWFDNNKSAEMFSRFCDYNKKNQKLFITETTKIFKSKHSVHWGINPPPLLFFVNSHPWICKLFKPAFLGNPPYMSVFRDPVPPKNGIF